ncbi:hypothetical protein C8A00DRAFT_17927 [Chaetomidium leptoderma]|uniref:Steroid 5-alpha reductase C-terminal domain-containing protein n=1 Tax=Chaetomidium leptoderma TaxID=669021 RepID=A0AAN6ZST2_9PEZI|nr:hypothetical protein C8A00DRAFT_17927 [Chaetomidium leptoderma]
MNFLLKLPLILAITLALQSLFRFPAVFLLNLLRCTAATLTIQTAVALPSVLWFRSELLYDVSGALCFVVVAGLSLGLSTTGDTTFLRGLSPGLWREVPVVMMRGGGGWRALGVDWRQGVVSLAVCVWAGRLGIYTFRRTLHKGGDSRFDFIRYNPKRFFSVFMLQALWVTMCTLPVVALNSVPFEAFEGVAWQSGGGDPVVLVPSIMRMFWFWLGAWSIFRGFMIECVADWQMAKWAKEKEQKKHDEVFCGKGLWYRSRHPNYYGECLIWLGFAMVCSSVVMASSARKAMGLGFMTGLVLCYLSPYFVYKLVRNISIPIIENKYDALYMTRTDYRKWRRSRTFRLWMDSDPQGIRWNSWI